MLDLPHYNHLGIDKCQYRARQCIYWPNINNDIKNLVLNCEICLKFRNSNIKEPLIPSELTEHPWETVSPVNRDIKMAPPCKRYRKDYTWQVSSIRHIINIAEFATLGGCRSPRHTGE
jgi:hypothetical protein